eukprot:m.67440 g.67440  ORF g.67440 m.67440 type:complete len:733 (-) comp23813_c0_seq2:225-2423(-)
MALKIPSQASQIGSKSKTGLSSKSGIKNSSSSSLRTKSRVIGVLSRSRLSQASRIGYDGEDGDDGYYIPKDPVPPADQLDLTEEELKVESTRILRGDDPHAPDNIIRFSFKENTWNKIAAVEQCAIHFEMDGNLIHNESDEARRQNARKNIRTRKNVTTATAQTETADAGTDAPDDTGADEETEDAEEKKDEDDEDEENEKEEEQTEEPEEEASEGGKKLLRNQFNFSERASQTFNATTKERGIMTVPPPRSNFSSSCTQWEIYDAYVADKAAKKAKTEKQQKKTDTPKNDAITFDRGSVVEEGSSIWVQAAKIVTLEGAKKLERMTLQNIHDEVLQDFKYWEDNSDQFKPKEGSVLPLWKFSGEQTKKLTVTALEFFPKYNDLMSVGFGSYDYSKQDAGAFACYSLKNPASPEYFVECDSGVMTIDILPSAVNMVVVGFYDGSVAVYNMASKTINTPTHKSTALTGKHTDPVWQVKWQSEDIQKRQNFYSVSADGYVRSWTLVKNELHYRNVIQLKRPEDPQSSIALLHAGTCFAFNSTEEHMYLVGTESGDILKCSKAYSSKYLETYPAHSMAVYTLAWNKFHPSVFASCSADWTLKIWDHTYPISLFEFDLGASVGSVAWAPFSSTVFAATTSDGNVHVFDLSLSKTDPVCVQPVIRKGKLTHVAFNPIHPIIIVGDDKGCVTSLKLSPNLRVNLSKVANAEDELERLNKLLDSVKELDIQTGKPLADK